MSEIAKNPKFQKMCSNMGWELSIAEVAYTRLLVSGQQLTPTNMAIEYALVENALNRDANSEQTHGFGSR